MHYSSSDSSFVVTAPPGTILGLDTPSIAICAPICHDQRRSVVLILV